MRDKCDRSTQFLYGWTVEIDLMIAKLVLSQLKWKGISQDNTRISISSDQRCSSLLSAVSGTGRCR